METARVLRQRFPHLALVYGGVYPSYAAHSVLCDNPSLDVIVRGEGEETVVELAEALARRYGVRIVWLADENFAADREAARETLEQIVARDLGLSLNLNMTAADVVRDADLLPLYKRAGVDNIVMGVVLAEMGEFFFHSRLVPPGRLAHAPGHPTEGS